MPYITLEYSNNIKIKDFKPLFEDLKNQLVATGEVQELGVKCRAVSSTDYFIVNGNTDYKMVHFGSASKFFKNWHGRFRKIF
jgi:5-carboxymethyl-2-hydroxymuconate isomerase